MPDYNWSNPSGDQTNTMAHIAASGNPLGPSIAPLIAEIIRMKQKQSEENNKGISNLLGGIAGGITGAAQNQSSGKLSDFIQSGLTDQSDALINPQQQQLLSSMTPQARLKALDWLQHAQDSQQKEDLQRELIDARANEINAHANQRWTNPAESGGDVALDQRHQQLIEQARMTQAKEQLATMFGVKPNELPPIIAQISSYKEGVTEFPKVGIYQQGNGLDGGLKQNLIDAVKSYRDLMSRSGSLNSPGTVTPNTQGLPEGQSAPGLDVSGRPIPGATSSSTTPTRQGAGPTDQAIAFLQAHPETAKEFDLKYGQGLAAQFLQ